MKCNSVYSRRLCGFFSCYVICSGLDPAGPSFTDTDPEVRLDPTDANFVDVIHTDGEELFNLGL